MYITLSIIVKINPTPKRGTLISGFHAVISKLAHIKEPNT
jgi:hypothetical protein